jgi:hypothetical protein
MYTRALFSFLLSQINTNLVVILINRPQLGIGTVLTPAEIDARLNITMAQAALWEISSYSRFIVTTPIITIPTRTAPTASLVATATFTPSGGPIGPFTHALVVRGANLVGASPANGNNRGSNVGTVVHIETVVSAPLSVAPPAVYNCTINLLFNEQT